MMKIYLTKFFSDLLFLIVVFNCSFVYSGIYPYPEFGIGLVKEINSILINDGFCRDIHDCNKKEFVLGGGKPREAIISIYKAEELTQVTILKIINLCTNSYYLKNNKVLIDLKFFKESRKERYAWFSRSKPFIHIQLKEK